MLGQWLQRRKTKLLHHVDEAFGTRVIGGNQRENISAHFNGLARIGENDVDHVVIQDTGFANTKMGDERAFFEGRIGLGCHADTAHINDVAGGGEKRHQFALEKNRSHHDVVKQMPGAEPRVIGDENIARLHRALRIFFEKMCHRCGHGVDVAGGAGHGLGNHLAPDIIDTRRQVSGFAGDGAESRAEQGLGLFLDHGNQAVPHDLGANGVEGVFAHAWRSMMILP